MTDSLSIAVQAFISRISMTFSADKWSVNLSISFRELAPSVEMLPVWLNHMHIVLCALAWRLMPAAARSKLYRSVSVLESLSSA